MKKQLVFKFNNMAECTDEFGGDPAATILDVMTNPDSIIGITPIEAEVVSARVEGEDIVGLVTVDPKDWVRQCIQLDEDLLSVLAELKPQLTREEMADLLTWIREASDLTISVISADALGEISTDQYPTSGKDLI